MIWNYGKGLDQQSVQDLAQGILKEAENAGRQVDEKMTEASGSVCAIRMKLSKDARSAGTKRSGTRSWKYLSLEMIFQKWMILQEMLLIHIQGLSETVQQPKRRQYSRQVFIRYLPMFRWERQTGATPDGRYGPYAGC